MAISGALHETAPRLPARELLVLATDWDEQAQDADFDAAMASGTTVLWLRGVAAGLRAAAEWARRLADLESFTAQLRAWASDARRQVDRSADQDASALARGRADAFARALRQLERCTAG